MWQERGRAPADLCKLLCVACYIHDEDQPSSSIFDALLDVDRTGKRLLFTPQESSRYSNSNSGDDGEQAEEQLSPEATLLAELIETAAYHGNTQRTKMLLALPLADCLGEHARLQEGMFLACEGCACAAAGTHKDARSRAAPPKASHKEADTYCFLVLLSLLLLMCSGPKTLGDILHRLSYGLGMHYIRGKARASVEEVFPVMCQLPAAKVKGLCCCFQGGIKGERANNRP